MANDLDLLISFVDGQGAGAATYVTYAEDHDSNYVQIQANFNVLNAEVKAFAGNNAILALDLIRSSSPLVVTGFVGADSFAPVAFLSADTQISIPVGVAFTSVEGRIQSNGTALLTGGGASGARFVALNGDGSVTLETASSQGEMDLYSVNWNGASFDTGTLTRLEVIMVDGDDFQNQKIVLDDGQSTDAGLEPFTYDVIADKLDDFHRLFLGLTVSADANQGALNGLAISGSAANPWLSLSDGTSVFETTTGLYRAGVNQLGVSVLALNVVTFAETAVNEPQLRLRAGTSLTDPPFAFAGDLDSGLGWVSANEWRAIAGGNEAFRFFFDAVNGQAGFVDGAVGTPGLVLQGDRDTGFYATGTANQLALATAGIQALLANQAQQITAPNMFRVATTDASFSIPNSGTLTNIELDTEVFDVGTMHDNVTNPDQHVVPTNGAGRYLCIIEVEFPDPGTPDGFRHIAITIQGAVVRETRVNAEAGAETILSCSIVRDLSDADVVRAQAAHDDTGGALLVRSAVEVIRIA